MLSSWRLRDCSEPGSVATVLPVIVQDGLSPPKKRNKEKGISKLDRIARWSSFDNNFNDNLDNNPDNNPQQSWKYHTSCFDFHTISIQCSWISIYVSKLYSCLMWQCVSSSIAKIVSGWKENWSINSQFFFDDFLLLGERTLQYLPNSNNWKGPRSSSFDYIQNLHKNQKVDKSDPGGDRHQWMTEHGQGPHPSLPWW